MKRAEERLTLSRLEKAVFSPRYRGKLRLARAYSRLRGLTEHPFVGVAETKLGRFYVDTRLRDDWALLFGSMEEDELRWVRRFFPRLRHAWDIGAHHGLYAIALGRVVQAGGRIHAFEPFPDSAEVIRRNVELNNLSQVVTVHERAIGERSGDAMLQVSALGPQNHSLREALQFSGREVRVSVTSMDEVAAHYGVPEFVKVDVEGGEYEVFAGGSGLLARQQTWFLFESERWDRRRDEVQSLLRSHGYVISSLVRSHEIPGSTGRMLIARPQQGASTSCGAGI
jgi:FkbM family methyltransferase